MHYTTLISASDLLPHVAQANWIVLDCRHDLMDPQAGRSAFDGGHLPGAQFASVDTALADKQAGGGRHPLPSRESFLATLRSWGVNDDSQVIAYDAHGGMYAARLWWMLRWIGHDAVAVLDGGLPAWMAAGGALSTAGVNKPTGNLRGRASAVNSVTVADLVANLANGTNQVVDARAPDRFRGENETIDPVGGHIPGAANRFFKDNLQADGRFKPAAQLQAEWRGVIDVPAEAIMQCGSGVSACHNLLALEIAGLPGAALYPGSWSEWCTDPARPVATGD